MRTLSLTHHGMQKLKNQHAALKNRYHRLVANLREDADEDAEVRALRRIEVDLLRDQLDRVDKFLRSAKLLQLAEFTDSVELGSQVHYSQDGSKHKITLVDPYETDALSGYIPVDSPVGSALLGRSVGDKVKFAAPDGRHVLKVLAIS